MAISDLNNLNINRGFDPFQPGHKVQLVGVSDPYRPGRLCRYRPLPGNKYVLVTISVTNTDTVPVVASFSDFRLETDRGRKYPPIVMPEINGEFDDFGAARCPAPGMTESGTLLFELPFIAKLVALYESIDGGERRIDIPPPSNVEIA